MPAAGTDVVFHLAAAVSGECEADFDLGMRSNFDTTRALRGTFEKIADPKATSRAPPATFQQPGG